MLTPKVKKLVRELCAALDRDALQDVMQMVKSAHAAKLKMELGGWRIGQKVKVNLGSEERLTGAILSINQKTLTVNLGNRNIRVAPSALEAVSH